MNYEKMRRAKARPRYVAGKMVIDQRHTDPVARKALMERNAQALKRLWEMQWAHDVAVRSAVREFIAQGIPRHAALHLADLAIKERSR